MHIGSTDIQTSAIMLDEIPEARHTFDRLAELVDRGHAVPGKRIYLPGDPQANDEIAGRGFGMKCEGPEVELDVDDLVLHCVLRLTVARPQAAETPARLHILAQTIWNDPDDKIFANPRHGLHTLYEINSDGADAMDTYVTCMRKAHRAYVAYEAMPDNPATLEAFQASMVEVRTARNQRPSPQSAVEPPEFSTIPLQWVRGKRSRSQLKYIPPLASTPLEGIAAWTEQLEALPNCDFRDKVSRYDNRINQILVDYREHVDRAGRRPFRLLDAAGQDSVNYMTPTALSDVLGCVVTALRDRRLRDWQMDMRTSGLTATTQLDA